MESGNSEVRNQGESLEAREPVISTASTSASESTPSGGSSTTSGSTGSAGGAAGSSPGGKRRLSGLLGLVRALWQRFNIYLLLFTLLIILASIGIVILYMKNRAPGVVDTGVISQQELPAGTLQELAANGIQVGDPKQVLNIQSNSVFAGAVLVKGELQVAGGLKIGSGSLAVPDVNIGGNATISQIQAQSLGVANTAQLSEVSISRNLSVNGNGTFTGGLTTSSLTVGRLQLNGDLAINRHIVAGGATPGRANGSALGGGGTTSVSGSDSAGSISINTGGGPAAGCFATLTFVNAFGGTPSVVLTPIGSAAAGLDYYVNRSATNFSVCTTSPAPANSAFGFDYLIIE